MKQVDICMCEPFILPGFLPTLGTPTLKQVLTDAGFTARIFYPSVRLFAENRLQENPLILSAIDNIPLQFSEYLFTDADPDTAARYVLTTLKQEGNQELLQQIQALRQQAFRLLEELADDIADAQPRVLCHSLTFGDYNFAARLFRAVKDRLPDIHILVGGSCCTPEVSRELLTVIPGIDAVVCDETYDATVAAVRDILQGLPPSGPHLTTHTTVAESCGKLRDLNTLPPPDFDDFIQTLDLLKNPTEAVILPYEISRGCWWGEKHPCAMCGYFGNQRCFIIKSPEKAARELQLLKQKYHTAYFRLTDLVQPQRDYLAQLKEHGMEDTFRLFWEMRPNVTESDIALLRSIGLFYAQTGLESLSTQELKYIGKGTTAVNNIAVLRHCATYRIHVVWNFLYGFREDHRSWYEEAMQIMPRLYHLQPPDPREVWLNKCSRLYAETPTNALVPIGDNTFYPNFHTDLTVFFKTPKKPEMTPVYEDLCQQIANWKRAFYAGYALYERPETTGTLTVVREYGSNCQEYPLNEVESALYQYCHTPRSLQNIQQLTEGSGWDASALLARWVQQEIMLFLDGKYLSLATGNSKYRWQKFQVLPNMG